MERTGESLVEKGRFEAAEQARRSIEGLTREAIVSGDVTCEDKEE